MVFVMTETVNFTLKDMGRFADFLRPDANGKGGKYFAGADLGLTGTEISLNCLPAGTGTPFVHAHKKNEELYIVLRGEGTFFVDGAEFPVQEGSLVRVAPAGERACKAGATDLYFICLQAQAGSLTQATMHDGILLETKTSWIK